MKWCTFDPGESAGWSIWEDDKLVDAGTTPMWELADILFEAWIVGLNYGDEDPRENEDLIHAFAGVEEVYCEDFALYPWLLRDGSLDWNKVRTARLIGAITGLCRWAFIKFTLQPALIKDTAIAAGAESLFMSPLHDNRHANDAIMHGVYKLAVDAGARPVPLNEDGGS